MYRNKTVAVVVPVYNEEKLIGKVIEAIPDFVDKIITVDDKSTDNSVKILESYSHNQKGRFILLINEHNEGVGGAIIKGYKQAIQEGVDIVVKFDGDAQMDPAELPGLLDPIIDNVVDFTKGNRLFTGEAYRIIPKVRYFGNTILSLLTKIASGYWHIADSQSGYHAINRKALLAIDWNKMYKRYGQPNDLLVRLNVYNFRVKDVPIKPIYNIGEKSGLKIRVVLFSISWLLLKLFLWRLKEKYVIRDFHPLVFFYLLGFLLLGTSGFLFIRAFYFRFLLGYFPPITALAWMFSISMGCQSLFFAMWFDMEYHKYLKS